MNKLLNNLLGMYKQAKLNKKAEEDLIEVGWGLYTNDEYEIKDNALYGDDKPQEVNETFWNKINNEIDKVESWFLKEGYKKFFTKVRDEGHGKDSELGGTAWMTENQLKDFMANAEQWDTEFVLAESSGTLDFGNIPVDYNEALSFKLKIYVDDKDLNELGIESKRISKNKKLSSKNTKLTKKAGIPDVYKNNAIVKRIEEMLAKMDMKIKSIEGKGLDYKKVNTDSMMPGSSSFSGSSFKEILNKVNEYFKTSKYNKQSSNSKAKDMSKKAEYTKKDYLNHFREIKQDVLFDNKGDFVEAVKDLLGFASSEYDKARFPREDVYNLVKEYIDDTINFQEMINHPIKEEYIVKAKELLNKYKVENKIANSIKTLHKKAEDEKDVDLAAKNYEKNLRESLNKQNKRIKEDIKRRIEDLEKANTWDNVGGKEKQLGIIKRVENELSQTNDIKESLIQDMVESYKSKYPYYSSSSTVDAGKVAFYLGVYSPEVLKARKEMIERLSMNESKQSSKAKLVRKQAKYEETVQGDEKVKDSAKSFGYDIKFAGHYGKWIYYYLIDEKGNIIRDDKEYQKVYDEMKKRIDDDIDIDNYAFAKGLIEEVDGELMRVPTIAISEYSLLSNHKDREENTGLEEFKRDFNLSSSTKKKAGIDPNVSAEDILKLNFDMPIEKADKVKEQFNEKGIKYQSRKGKYTVEFSVDIEAGKVDLVYEIIRNIKKSSSTKKQATIKHENGVYNVYSESGKCLGKGYKTKEEAEKRLKQVEYFKNKKASVIKKAKNLSEIDGDAEFMSDLEIGNGMPYNSDDYDYFEVYKIHAKNPKDTYNNKYVVVSDDGSILAVREKEEDIIEITYDDMLQELRWRRLSNRKTQPNKRTSLKKVEYFKHKNASRMDWEFPGYETEPIDSRIEWLYTHNVNYNKTQYDYIWKLRETLKGEHVDFDEKGEKVYLNKDDIEDILYYLKHHNKNYRGDQYWIIDDLKVEDFIKNLKSSKRASLKQVVISKMAKIKK